LLVCEQVQKNNHSSLCNNPGVQANTMRQCSIKDSRELQLLSFIKQSFVARFYSS